MSSLTHTVKSDPLGIAICDAIKKYSPKTILEIGSSDGTGSTSVILESTDAEVFCLEMDAVRFDSLKLNTAKYKNANCFNMPSVGVDGMVAREYIDGFKAKHPKFNVWEWIGITELKKWWDNTLYSIKTSPIQSGIAHIKDVHGIESFDMVLIDGGPFTGLEEAKQCIGSNVIILDDVLDIKCWDAYEYLKTEYKLEHENLTYRNGFAVFVKK